MTLMTFQEAGTIYIVYDVKRKNYYEENQETRAIGDEARGKGIIKVCTSPLNFLFALGEPRAERRADR